MNTHTHIDKVKAWTWRVLLTITAALMIGACGLLTGCGKGELIEPQQSNLKPIDDKNMASKDSVKVRYVIRPDVKNNVVMGVTLNLSTGSTIKTGGSDREDGVHTLEFTLKKGTVINISMRASYRIEKGIVPYNAFVIEDEAGQELYRLDKPTGGDPIGWVYYEGSYTVK